MVSESTSEPTIDEIRSLNPEDLDSIVSLIKPVLSFDELSDDLIKFRMFEDPDFDPELSLGAIIGGRIVSLVCATNPIKFPKASAFSSKESAWIKIFLTEKGHRRRGIESKLFERLFSVLRNRGVKEVRFSDRGNWHFWPGVDLQYEEALDFLLEMGFTKISEELDYLFNLSEFYYPSRVQKLKQRLEIDGVEIRPPKESEKQELLDWIEKRFSPFWSNETEFALNGSLFPSVFLARDKNGKLLGFAAVNGVAPGRFGPTGVDGNQRKRGVGTVLLFEAFQAMKDQGLEKAVVHWTDLLFFYAQVPGLSGVRDYWIMRRPL